MTDVIMGAIIIGLIVIGGTISILQSVLAW